MVRRSDVAQDEQLEPDIVAEPIPTAAGRAPKPK
jgi:hypothetical protein